MIFAYFRQKTSSHTPMLQNLEDLTAQNLKNQPNQCLIFLNAFLAES